MTFLQKSRLCVLNFLKTTDLIVIKYPTAFIVKFLKPNFEKSDNVTFGGPKN